jgi:hypothetical protein
LNGETTSLPLRTGDALDARTFRTRGGEKLRRRALLFIGFAGWRTGGGRALVSLTTVTPDAFMKF